ncbi:transmembrane protein [Thraustotheca clavata]|uniref:Transmembrane protein n=1 Tax=Thraustotheca clavata TaxID=74557 RepID=A0A1V9ZHL2_9STRA|nr:transmembrane protein [Thraustotheca clavata]
MNNYEYGGSFDWAFGPNTVYGILLIPCFSAIVMATVWMVEEKVIVMHFKQYFKNLWTLMQLRVMWQFCAFQLLNQTFISFDTTVSSPIASNLLGVQPVADQSFTVLGILLYTGTMFSIGKYALNWDWHRTVIFHTVLICAIDAFFKLSTVWGLVENQYFYLTGRTLLQFPTAFLFLFTTYCIVEVADVGNEGAVYALVTTCANVASPVATFLFKTVDSFFSVTIADIQLKNTKVRWELTYCYVIMYAVKLLSLVWLVLLPRQKAHVQILKRSGGSSRTMGLVMVIVVSFSLLWSSESQQKPNKIWLLDEKQLEDFVIMEKNGIPKNDLGVMESQTLDHDTYLYTDKDSEDYENDFGPLRSGEVLNFFSVEAIALLTQYCSVGFLNNTLPALAYPVFQNYLRMQGYQVSSYSALVKLGWSFKIFFGIMSDCFPLFGLQRRPYIILGWIICAVSCAIMAFTPFSQPYYGKKSLVGLPLVNISKEDQDKYINLNAPNSSALFVILSMFASLGYVMTVTTCDALSVQYAQREPLSQRGRWQTMMYLVRDFTGMIPRLIVGFCMNNYEYGGSFDWAIRPSVVYFVLLIPCFIAIVMAAFWMVEEKVFSMHYKTYFKQLWALIEKRVMWQFCAFQLLNQTLFFFDTTVTSPVESILLGVQPIANQVFTVFGIVLYTVTMFSIGKYALNWDWHRTIIANTVLICAIDAAFKFPTVWGVIDNQYIYLFGRVLLKLPDAFLYLFTAYCIVEVADVGNEGAVYALITTCANVSIPVATFLFKTVNSFFAVNNDDIERKDSTVRWQLTYCYGIMFIAKLSSLLFLMLLPRQKAHVQILKRTGGSSRPMGIFIVAIVGFFLVGVIVTNLLAMYPSTNCLRIAGGSGC